MGKIISVMNYKGGVLKTTSTFNLSAALALSGFKVLMIDYDPQANLTIVSGLNIEDYEDKNIGTVFSGDKSIVTEKNDKGNGIKNIIVPLKTIDNLFIAPSHIYLSGASKINEREIASETTLKRILDTIKDDYDFIFIDCSPMLSSLSFNALVASDYTIIPSSCEYLSYCGLGTLMENLDEIRCKLNANVNVIGVIATKYKAQVKNQKEIFDALKENFKVIGTINETESATKGIYDGVPVVAKPDGRQAKQVADEYKRIASQYIAPLL